MKGWRQINAVGAAATAVALLVIVTGCAVSPATERSASPIPTSSLPAATAATAADGGDAAGPTAAPSPSGSSLAPSTAPSSTAPPALTPAATPLASVTSGPLRIDGLALVVADELRVRSAPGTGADSTMRGYFGTETRLFVIDGPVTDSGYDWYQVAPIAEGEDHGDAWDRTWGDGVSFRPELRYRGIAAPIGWVASAARDGTPWIVGLPLDCPDLDSQFDMGLSPLVALACYGDAAIHFEGSGGFTIGENGRLDSYVGETGLPRWLMDRSLRRYWFSTGIIDPGEFFGTALDPIHLPSGFPDTNSYEWRVGGHFDDQVAGMCRTDTGSSHPDDPYATVLMCRATFVITELAPTDVG